ncbi:sensor histidine kinase [Streptomyces sp. NPDC091267]|uniref:sensor histidine kinase n=1 Tax=Streptomyces sp. NPDC091267 TaxID=3155195 RepID=UPI0034152563
MYVSAAGRLRDGCAALVRPAGPLPRPNARDLVLDAVLALVFAAVAVDYAVSAGTGTTYQDVGGVTQVREGAATWFGALAPVLLCSVPLVLRRRYPLAVLWAVMAAGLLAPDSEARIVFYAFVIATYSAVVHSPYRMPTTASIPVALLVLNGVRAAEVPTVPNEYVPLLILIPLAAAAGGLRTWKLRADERQTRMAELERARAEELDRAAERERSRIARELHDVVTHHVSMMVIQAGAARKVMDAAPDLTLEALLAIESGGRAAMAELRHTMGLLTLNTGDDGEAVTGTGSAALAPQPGLDELASLVGRVRGTGVPVELTVTGTPHPVPPGVGLAAYRVVQEALTNTVKHAAGASAKVVVEYGAGRLYVEITDTGGRPSTSAATGDGHGLMGLRERLSLYGGTLRADPRPGGGFRTAALIPLEAM